MTKYNFTMEDLRREVLALADERPDFVYTTQKEREGLGSGTFCSYTGAVLYSTKGEACIFGQALTRLGVPQEVLMGNSNTISSVLDDYLGFEWADVRQVYDPFIAAQQFQDGGTPWGDAVQPIRNLEIKTT